MRRATSSSRTLVRAQLMTWVVSTLETRSSWHTPANIMFTPAESTSVSSVRLPTPIKISSRGQRRRAVASEAKAVREAMATIGYRHFNPFMSVSTLPLLVSLERKLSDHGLVDVDRRRPTHDPDGRAEPPAMP